jgi:hypothetical protein
MVRPAAARYSPGQENRESSRDFAWERIPHPLKQYACYLSCNPLGFILKIVLRSCRVIS